MIFFPRMSSRTRAVHVVTTKRTYQGKIYRTHLLRRSYREGKSVKNETLGNLSHLPEPLIDMIRSSLQGEKFVPVREAFEVVRSRPQVHIEAITKTMEQLGMASLLASRPSQERKIVLAMIAARIAAHTRKFWHPEPSDSRRSWNDL